jgi:hypothetical protein
MKLDDNKQIVVNLKKETALLKRVIIRQKKVLKKALKINHQTLFNIWADFDDTESSKEVMRFCEDLGNIDAISFMAFCYGYEKAVEKVKECL